MVMNKSLGIVFLKHGMHKLPPHIRKICSLVAAGLILPALAHAKDIQWDKWDSGDKGEKGGRCEKGGKGYPRVSAVPEANTVWILVPFMGAVLLYSGRHLTRKKATE